MSQVEVDKIIPQSGTTLTIGDSGDTITVASGATLTGDLNADNLTSGTVPTARLSGAYTGITQTGTLASFASTGIDDNATSTAITINSSEDVTFTDQIFVTGNINGSDEVIVERLQLNGSTNSLGSTDSSGYIFKTGGAGSAPFNQAGALLYQPRTHTTEGRSNHLFYTGNPLALRQNIHPNGDISFYEDTGTTAKLFWDASAESLGIGTSSPTNKLEVDGGGTFNGNVQVQSAVPRFRLIDTDISGHSDIVYNTNILSFACDALNNQINSKISFSIDGSAKMRIDTSGNVGIGTTSPSQALDVVGSVYCDGLQVDGNVVIQQATGDVSLTLAANENGSNREPSLNLKGYNSSSNPIINFGDSSGYPGAIEYENSDNSMRLWTNGSERMRIDSSGTLFVGKTVTNVDTDGVSLNTGVSTFSVSNDRTITINRNGSDGSLIEFYKDGSTSLNLRTISGGLEFSSSSTGYLNILSNGNVGINQTSPTEKLHVTGNIRTNNISNRSALQGIGPTPNDGNNFELGAGFLNLFRDDTVTVKTILFGKNGSEVGNITTTGSTTAYNTSSDYRLKENIAEITDATSRLKQLQPKRFNFIKDADTTVDGFIAHEVSSVVPEAVTGTHNEVKTWKEYEELPEGVSVGDNKLDENGNTIPEYQGIDQSKLVPLLVKTIQEQQTKIEDLEARITTLETTTP